MVAVCVVCYQRRTRVAIGVILACNLVYYIFYFTKPIFNTRAILWQDGGDTNTSAKFNENLTRFHTLPFSTFVSSSIGRNDSDFSKVFSGFNISYRDLVPDWNKTFPSNSAVIQKVVNSVGNITAMISSSGIDLSKYSAMNTIVLRPSTTTTPPPPPPTNPHPYNFTILEKNLCSNRTSKGPLILLLVICSAVPYSTQRAAIRATWASNEVLKTHNIVRLFFVGSTSDEDSQKRIDEESEHFRDIVQENFIDSYNNLSIKSVGMLKWVHENCKTAQYVLKTDDDTYFNIANLMPHLKRTAGRFILGNVFVGAKPIQDKKSKWYTPTFSEKVYPQYVSGAGYILSSSIVYDMYNASLYTPLFWLEDIYITGICARSLRITYIELKGLSYRTRAPNGCSFVNGISGHRVKPTEMYTIWKEINSGHLNCTR